MMLLKIYPDNPQERLVQQSFLYWKKAALSYILQTACTVGMFYRFSIFGADNGKD